MKAIIIGCDYLGAQLAYRLNQHGHEVVVVDREKSSFVNLHKGFKGRTHEGDALNREVLLRAGIEEVDVVAVLTTSDMRNNVLGHVAKELYKVPNVVVRIFDPAYQRVCELMGLQAVSSAIAGAELLEKMLCHDTIDALFKIGGGEVEIYAIRISREFSGKSIGEVVCDRKHQLPAAVTRSGKSMIVDDSLVLMEDDILHITADHRGLEQLTAQFKLAERGGEQCS